MLEIIMAMNGLTWSSSSVSNWPASAHRALTQTSAEVQYQPTAVRKKAKETQAAPAMEVKLQKGL